MTGKTDVLKSKKYEKAETTEWRAEVRQSADAIGMAVNGIVNFDNRAMMERLRNSGFALDDGNRSLLGYGATVTLSCGCQIRTDISGVEFQDFMCSDHAEQALTGTTKYIYEPADVIENHVEVNPSVLDKVSHPPPIDRQAEQAREGRRDLNRSVAGDPRQMQAYKALVKTAKKSPSVRAERRRADDAMRNLKKKGIL